MVRVKKRKIRACSGGDITGEKGNESHYKQCEINVCISAGGQWCSEDARSCGDEVGGVYMLGAVRSTGECEREVKKRVKAR